MSFPGRSFVRAVSRLLPFARRRDWLREWEAEAAYAWERMTRNGSPGLLARWSFRLRIWSSVFDALWERKETMTMSGFMKDLRFALRSLARNRGFTAVAVLTLALGIGANTAVFTLVDGVLIRPLPYPDGDRLVSLQHQGRDGQDQLPMSTGLYQLYRDEARTIDEIGLYASTAVNLVVEADAQRISAQVVTPSFFDVLQAEPRLGRAFVESEGAPEGEQVVMLSDGFWRNTYGADPGVLGQTIDINGTLREIVGVMPADFGFPNRDALVWLPLVIDPNQAPLANFGSQGVARAIEGADATTVHTDLAGLITRLDEFFPESGAVGFLREVNLQAVVLPMKEAIVGDVSTTLWILLGTVGVVLLIACANVANLLLVRAEGKQRELALRVAVGAGRTQILRWFMSESLVLTGVGGILGIGVAWLAVRTTLGFVPTDIPRMSEVGVDLRVLAFTAAVAVGCAIFFGLFPLVRYGTDDLAGQLKDGSARGSTGGREQHRLRNGLVVAQMALALVLLIGSGLMFRSFQALRSVDPGFDPEGVMTARLTVPAAEVQGWAEVDGFYRQLEDRMLGVPGVSEVGFVQGAPLVTGGAGYFAIESEDHPRGPDELPLFANNNAVSPGYLEAMGIDVLEGRTPQEGDGADAARSIVVNETFARMWWPEQSPLGRRMRLGYQGEDWYTIVGVVEDSHYADLQTDPQEMVYWPLVQGPAEAPQAMRGVDIVVKTSRDPLELVPILRREVQALNPRIPVSNPTTMRQAFDGATARTSFTMALLGSASGIALLLGLVGIYGVISYVVSQRTREIGVRLALGASGGTVRGMVVKQGLALASAGVVLGVVVALGLSTVMASLLYGVSATDPMTYVVLAVALVATATAASWIPALRASRVDPARALRAE